MTDQDISKIGWHARSETGVVAAGGAAAVAAGISILERGGNAADSAVATILALNVTDHGACSIGSEVPLMIYDSVRREVKTLSGQGRAPMDRDAVDWYMMNGIPAADIKMAPVPAVIDLCITTLQQYGTLTFVDIVEPTLKLLDAGQEDWHPRLATTLRRLVEEEHLSGGNRQERLQSACDRFYGRHPKRNDIAEELEAFYVAEGGFLRRHDLAAHRTLVENPVVTDYRGYRVYKCGPWTQGPWLCQALRLLEGFNLRDLGHLSADYVHAVSEAMKLALADRDEYYADPNFVDVPLEALLSDAYTDLRRPLINMERASRQARPGDPIGLTSCKTSGPFHADVGGTTTCVIADRWGNVVAATPSANVYHAGGSGSSGVSFGNRLRSLNTTPGHPNCIQPGKRPRITLTPTLVLKDDKPILAISVAGGDLQDQAALNLLLDFIEFNIEPQTAVELPRFATLHHQDSFDPAPVRSNAFLRTGSLRLSNRVDPSVVTDLEGRGHTVEIVDDPVAIPVMLSIDIAQGIYTAAGDPAAGRHAAGLQN